MQCPNNVRSGARVGRSRSAAALVLAVAALLARVGRSRFAVAALVLALAALLAAPAARAHHLESVAADAAAAKGASEVAVTLSEWRVALSTDHVKAGSVTFRIANQGSVPHQFEVEGNGLEKQTPQIARGASGSLTVALEPGRYEVYCPIGRGSHRMLGMRAELVVGNAKRGAVAKVVADADEAGEHAEHEGHAMVAADDDDATGPPMHAALVTGGGPVIQILPGPFPFADSAAAVIASRPSDQRDDLSHKAQLGPYSNNVATISGTISLTAIDRGATGDSVSGLSEFTTQDGARWKLVVDRVQTRDIPDNPRFGGVIMGLYYHGATGVHTPLVPTIQSRVALWAFAHLYRNDQLVADDAMVHVMLLSRTRRPGDFALECWDCSRNPIDELQLQVTPSPGKPKFDAPGGFLFVNWEKSGAQALAVK